jgi:hypothetical protein
LKQERENLKKDLAEAKKKGKSENTIKKLENKLEKNQERGQKLRGENLANSRACEKMKEINREKRDCSSCRRIKQAKEIKNPLRRICLINKESIEPQIILLTKDLVCRYDNKDNFATFFDDKRKKVKKKMLRGKGKEITDVKVYSGWKLSERGKD